MQYVLMAWSSDSDDVNFYYGSGTAERFQGSGTYNYWPSTVTDQGSTRQYSIYATVQPVWTITASAGANGGINPSGAVKVNDSSSQTFAITPNVGYHITDVTVDGVSQGAITSYTFTNVTADHTVTASFAADEHALTVTVIGSGSVSESGLGSYHYGDFVELTATPSAGWSFAGWSGDITGSDNPHIFIVNDSMSVTATFTQNTYSLTVNTVGGGSVTLSSLDPYYYGDTVNLTAIADAGWIFSGWSGDLTGSDNPDIITIDGDKTITATFVQDEYALTISTVGNGAVSINITQPTCHHGEVVQLIAIPATGCSFSGWSGDFTSMDNPASITVTCDMAVTATFTINQYMLTVVQGEHGTITPGTTTVNYGSSQTFTITPDTGYHTEDVIVDGVSVGAVSSYAFTNVNGDHTITATFTETSLPDTTPPTICIDSPVNGETYCLNEIVIADWWVCDESGIYCSSATAPSGSAIYTGATGTFSFYVEAMDCAGNYNIVTVTYYVEEDPPSDTTPPTIVITIPEDGKTYALNEVVFADWFVTDEGSGVDESNTWGNVTSGSPIDTMILGINKFYVYAVDNAGNEASLTVFYNVVESSEIKSGDTAGPDPDLDPDDPTPPTPTYREPKPSPYVIQTRDNAASILSLLSGTSSVNATGHEGLDYNDDGVIDIADAFDQMCSAGILWAPAFKFDPGTASTFFDTLQVTYGTNLENFKPIDGRVWMLYVLTYLPYT